MTKTVPLHELQPGDVVTIPPLKVRYVDDTYVSLEGNPSTHVSKAFFTTSGATATREVPDPVFDLTWAQALDAMVTHGKTCARSGAEQYRYRFDGTNASLEACDVKDFKWHRLNQPSIHQFASVKWRIVASSGN